jgi:hypothetical protein
MTRVTPVLIVALTILASSASAGLAATAPGARTGGAGNVTPQTATLKGIVNPHGVPTAFYFQFGRTNGYGTRTSTSDAGSGLKGRGVSAPVTGLMPLTIYHYRLVAFSTAGTTRGGDRTFKTPQIPTISTISVSPNPVVYGKTVFVSGTLTGPDIGGKKVALQSKPFPFTGPFQQIGNTVLSSPAGAYSFIWPPTVTMQLRVLDQSKPSVKSPVFTASVALATTLRVRKLHRSRRPILFRGHVTPARVGNPVLIQRRKRRGWHTVAFSLTRAKSPSYSVFSRRLRLHRGGRYRAVVKTTAGDYVDGTSRTVRIKLRGRHRRR